MDQDWNHRAIEKKGKEYIHKFQSLNEIEPLPLKEKPSIVQLVLFDSVFYLSLHSYYRWSV